MPVTIQCRDESLSGESLDEWAMELLTETVTAREIIRSRVYQEVQDALIAKQTRRPLVKLTTEEMMLNNSGEERRRQDIDWTKQFAKAIDGFENGRFVLLVDDRQVEELDEELNVGPQTQVTFLKLRALVGG